MKSTPRTRRLGESVREALAEVLRDDIADPRLDFATITSVEVSADLNLANVYVTTHGGAEEYEALLEGLVLFIVLWVLSRRRREDGYIIGIFLTLYAVFRIAVEFFREPDVQLGFIAGNVTMGQILSVPMLLVGLWLVWARAST